MPAPFAVKRPAIAERVIVNLACNALRYSLAVAPPLLTARTAGNRVELRVVDHGPGIPAADRKRVFQPFCRLGALGDSTGVGLGLAVARGLAETMGGTLEPEDTPGGGLTMACDGVKYSYCSVTPATVFYEVAGIASFVVVIYALVTILPLVWIFLTGFKTPPDSIAYPPKILFEPSVEGYVNLFTTRSRQTPEFLASLPPPQTWYERLVRSRNMVIGGPSKVVPRFANSMIIAFGSTFLAVCFGTVAAYAFSRFRVPLADDLLFFILSTRMMPPIAVAIPIYLMFRHLGLSDTKLGMILLYTAVNVSLAVWLLKGFIDEIPREYEEAAMVDGYSRLQAFFRVVLPQATTGIAATAIFCLIFAWNEYAFAALLTSGTAQTAPPFIPTIIGEGGQDWPAVAAGTTIFLVPILVFTILLRKQLLRGITFGAVRK